MTLQRFANLSTLLALTGFLPFVIGCDNATSTNVVRPGLASQTIDIRPGVGPDVLADDVVVERAWIDGSTLRIDVSFSGGCAPHDFGAIAPAAFMESLPVGLPVYLRHQAHGDPCEAIMRRSLAFEIRPAVQLHLKQYHAAGPFVLALTTSSGSVRSVVRVRVP